MIITRLNPGTLHQNPAFTQVAVISGASKLVYVCGQNALDVNGKIVGTDIATQAAQAYWNVIAGLEAAGATLADVFKMTIYIVQGNTLRDAFGAVQQVQAERLPPPTVTVIMVAGLANPEFLIEIEAVAAL